MNVNIPQTMSRRVSIWNYAPLFFVVLHWFNPTSVAAQTKPNLANLPEPVLEKHKGWIDLYRKAWQLHAGSIRQGTLANNFVPSYVDEAFDSDIYQWDTCFMMLFDKYGYNEFPTIASLENFYRKQASDGFISRRLREQSGADTFLPTSDLSINPPLFSWAEWEHYNITGDAARFTKLIKSDKDGSEKTLLNRLIDYYYWIKINRRRPDGSYWTSGGGSGLDNTPNTGMFWVCLTSQQAQNAYYIAKIAEVTGDTSIKTTFTREHQQIKEHLNNQLWDKRDNFYHNLEDGRIVLDVKSAVAFWTMLARVADKEQAQALVAHLKNPKEFWRPHLVPSLSADDAKYDPTGRYWKGGVWAPTNYMIAAGLREYGYDDVARQIAMNHIENMHKVYLKTGTIHEAYSPEYEQPATGKDGKKAVRTDFVGWSGLGPIAMLIEDVIGIRVNAPKDSIVWNLALTEEHGIRSLRFGDNILSLIAAARTDEKQPAQITVKTSSEFDLIVRTPQGMFTHHFMPGESTVTVK